MSIIELIHRLDQIANKCENEAHHLKFQSEQAIEPAWQQIYAGRAARLKEDENALREAINIINKI